MKKRLVMLAVSAVTVASIITGCGSTYTEAPTATTTTAEAEAKAAEEAKALEEAKAAEAKAEEEKKAAEAKAEEEKKAAEAKAEEEKKAAEAKAEEEKKAAEAKAAEEKKAAEAKATEKKATEAKTTTKTTESTATSNKDKKYADVTGQELYQVYIVDSEIIEVSYIYYDPKKEEKKYKESLRKAVTSGINMFSAGDLYATEEIDMGEFAEGHIIKQRYASSIGAYIFDDIHNERVYPKN